METKSLLEMDGESAYPKIWRKKILAIKALQIIECTNGNRNKGTTGRITRADGCQLINTAGRIGFSNVSGEGLVSVVSG